MTATNSDDVLYGTSGADVIDALAGNDVVDGGSGDDRLFGNVGTDTLIGGDGDDLLAGQYGQDVLTGGAGADQFGFSVGDGDGDSITDYEYGEKIFLYGAPDVLEQYRLSFDGTDSHLDIDTDGVGGFDMSITLSGSVNGLLSLTQELIGSDPYEVITIAQANAVYGSQGNDTLVYDGSDAVTMFGLRGDDFINGGTADDTLYGGSGDDRLFGNVGTDTLIGGDGDDLLAGQYGQDVLTGGAGADQFGFSVGDGDGDSITDYEYGEKIFLYGAPDVLEQYRLSFDGTDSHLDIDTDGVGGFDMSITLSGSVNGLLSLTQELIGSDPYEVITIAQANAVYGSQGNDALVYGGSDAVTMFGLRGDDFINGGTADDALYGGSGDDRLFGNVGTDTLIGGDGDDFLAGQYDQDVLTGGAGADQFGFSVGDGDGDSITDYEYGEKIFLYGAPDDLEQYRLSFDGTDSHLDIDTDGVGGFDMSITLSGSVNGLLSLTQELIGGDPYEVITIAQANAVYGSQGNDALVYGGSDAVTMFGLRGDDFINGGTADDALYGGSGDDRLFGNVGTDTLIGGDGDDFLAGQYDQDVLTGGAGADQFGFSVGDGDGDSITDYEYGEKIFLYGAPDDLEQYRLSFDGTDSHLDIDTDGVGGFDMSITLSGSVNGLLSLTQELIGGDPYEVITIAQANAVYGSQGNDALVYGGSDAVTMFGLRGDDFINGGTADDALYGGSGDDRLFGNVGTDTLIGGDGDDFLAGQYDQDVLTGGAGADQFGFSVGDGDGDSITDYEYGEKIFLYGAPDDLEQYRLSFDGTDSHLDIDTDGVGGFDMSITLSGSVNGLLSLTQELIGGDPYEVITIAQANAVYGSQGNDALVYGGSDAVTMFGLRGDDFINGGTADDALYGGSGDDRLFGNVGTDTLIGGDGDDFLAGQYDQDVLTGGAGADQFGFSVGDGDGDSITDYEYGEKIFLYGAPDDLEQYRLSFDGTDSHLDIDTDGVGGFDMSITLSGSVNGLLSLTQELIGGDPYEVITIAQANAVYGSQGNDALVYGGSDAVTMFGLRGDDFINGGTADDALYGGSGDDRLFGNVGTDTLIGGDGDDFLAGQYDQDVLTGGAGADQFGFSVGDGDGDSITDYEYGEKIFLYGAPDDLEQYRLSFDGTDSHLDIDTDGVGGFDMSITLSGSVNGLLSLTQELIGGDPYEVITIAQANAVYGSQGNDALVYGGSDAVTMFGLRGDDFINGGTADDALYGGSGDDRLFGNVGTDTLIGGDGDDFLAGQSGVDVLTGGTGVDQFNFSPFDGNGDRITDYEYGEQLFIYNNGVATTLGQYTLRNNGVQTFVDFDSDNNGSPNLTLTLDGVYNGSLALTRDSQSGDTYEVLTIKPPNHAPTGSATAILGGGTEDTPYLLSTATLLAGFSDADGDTLSVSGPTSNHGSVTDNGDGTFTVTPTANYNGPVSLSYAVVDGPGGSIAATQSFSLAAVNDSPAGSPTAILADGTEDTAYTVAAAQLLAGFSDVEGDTLAVSGLSANHGSVFDNGNGTWTVTPTANYNGPVSLSYSVVDGHGGAASATQSFSLTAVNDPAIVSGTTSGTVAEAGGVANGTPGTPSASGTLTDTDVDNAANTFQAVVGGAATANGYGTFGMTGAGAWTYTLNNANAAVQALNVGGSLTDSFVVLAEDGTAQTISININGANDSPTVSAITVTGATIGFTPSDVDNATLGFASPFAAVFGNSVLSRGVPVNLTATQQAVLVSNMLRVVDGAGATTDVIGLALGTSGGDVITAPSPTGANVLYGFAGNDNVTGGSGSDTIASGTGKDTVSAGGGNDTIQLSNGDFTAGETMNGGAGTDMLVLLNAVTVDLSGGAVTGIETMIGGNGVDAVTLAATQLVGFGSIDLGTGVDTLNVVASGNIAAQALPTLTNIQIGNLTGTNNSESVTLSGSQLDAILIGGGTINFGGGGADNIYLTSTSIDLNTLGNTDSLITGLEGVRTADASAGVTIRLTGQTEAFFIRGGGSNDSLVGGSGADDIRGDAGNDVLGGNAGNDQIFGGAGSDTIFGGNGSDTLFADDRVIGSDGAGDTFVFDTALNASTNVDTIVRFEAGGNGSGALDHIFLSSAIFTGIGTSFEANEFRANSGGSAALATDRILYDTKTGTLYYDADGSGAGAKVAFASIDTKSLIGTVDFTDFIYGTPPAGP